MQEYTQLESEPVRLILLAQKREQLVCLSDGPSLPMECVHVAVA